MGTKSRQMSLRVSSAEGESLAMSGTIDEPLRLGNATREAGAQPIMSQGQPTQHGETSFKTPKEEVGGRAGLEWTHLG